MSAVEQIIVTMFRREMLDFFIEPMRHFPRNDVIMPSLMNGERQTGQRFRIVDRRAFSVFLPEFRGPNLRSNPHGREACGSELAQQDILDALDHVLKTERIAPGRVFLLGASGGGHAALLTAVRSPDRWRGIAVWCPVSDLTEWHTFFGRGNSYAAELEHCLGGSPDELPER